MVKLGLELEAPEIQGSPLHPSAALVHFLPAALPFSSLPSSPGAAQASMPGPVKSPACGSLVSGVAARRRLCSLTAPIHWPWLQPQEA